MMVQPAKERDTGEDADPLYRPMVWWVLGQRQGRADVVVVVGIGREDAPQVLLTADHNVVQALPPDREPISRSAYLFCQGDLGAIGRSRMPMVSIRRMTALP